MKNKTIPPRPRRYYQLRYENIKNCANALRNLQKPKEELFMMVKHIYGVRACYVALVNNRAVQVNMTLRNGEWEITCHGPEPISNNMRERIWNQTIFNEINNE